MEEEWECIEGVIERNSGVDIAIRIPEGRTIFVQKADFKREGGRLMIRIGGKVHNKFG